jgi:hypothetical protein
MTSVTLEERVALPMVPGSLAVSPTDFDSPQFLGVGLRF